MLTPDEHRAHLRGFEVDRLLKLLALEAAKYHNKAYSILSGHRGYQIAYGLPADDFVQRASQEDLVPISSTLKAAIIEALVSGKTWEGYYSRADAEHAIFRNKKEIEELAESLAEEEEIASLWASAPEATATLALTKGVTIRVPIYTERETELVGPSDPRLCPYAQGAGDTSCISSSGRSVCGGYLDHSDDFTLCQGV